MINFTKVNDLLSNTQKTVSKTGNSSLEMLGL